MQERGKLTESARMQIVEKLMFYQEQRETLTNELNKACSIEDKIKKILECDDRLKGG
jgi:hypothetical protein